jgi:signal transduction histidine kinase
VTMAGHASVAKRWRGLGLSSRLLLLTLIFVMIAEVLIFVPSIANFRNNWLGDRLASARTAALVLEAAPEEALPEELVRQLLKNVGAETIALRVKGARRLLAFSDMPPPVSATFDFQNMSAFRSISESFDILFRGGDRTIRAIDAAPMDGDFVEIVLKERPLRDAMLGFAGNILLLSLFISGITGALVFLALKRLIVRPVEKLTQSITRFADKPEDQTRLMKPSGRTDEIGTAETAVAGMQLTISQQLKQKEHLAALGLAVSKINHDLRNMLSSAQLISDRLGEVKDPTVQRFAPKLLQTLDRAIAFCQSTLAYGRAEERPPHPVPVRLHDLMEEVRDVIGLFDGHDVNWNNRVSSALLIRTDAEHLFRICTNLCRNALQAMETIPPAAGHRHALTIICTESIERWQIDIQDTGPGIPPAIREKLFDAFHGSTRPGGTGLGLAIASDLARALGGGIALARETKGACFQITLPKL